MLLFAGLGNPGRGYVGNRHNIGFMAVDAIAAQHRFPAFRPRFQGQVSEAVLGGERVLILKPETYMNESGRAVGEAARYFKLDPKQVIVFHDELDLAPGKVRVKVGGGNAGHNGLRSITERFGNDYSRVRLGIGHPGDKTLVHDYVLGNFPKAEKAWVDTLCQAVAANADDLVKGDTTAFQNKVYRAMEAAGFGKDGLF
jgi:PTH1 family peptidyl-tRNA hydrolase